jgi:hypothetical protein
MLLLCVELDAALLATNIECVGTASTTPPIPAWYLTAAAWQHILLHRPNDFELQLLQPHWIARKRGFWSIFSCQELRLFQIHDGRLYVPIQRGSLQKCGRNHIISRDIIFLCGAICLFVSIWRLIIYRIPASIQLRRTSLLQKNLTIFCIER